MALHYSILQCVAACCSVHKWFPSHSLLPFVAAPWAQVVVCGGVLKCVAVCCSVLPSVVVCCSVLQCVAVCCSVLQCILSASSKCVAKCCSVLQRLA